MSKLDDPEFQKLVDAVKEQPCGVCGEPVPKYFRHCGKCGARSPHFDETAFRLIFGKSFAEMADQSGDCQENHVGFVALMNTPLLKDMLGPLQNPPLCCPFCGKRYLR